MKRYGTVRFVLAVVMAMAVGAVAGEGDWREARGMTKGKGSDVVKVKTAGAEAKVLGVGQEIRLEYFDHVHKAHVTLLWSSASTAKEVVPQACLYPQTDSFTTTNKRRTP